MIARASSGSRSSISSIEPLMSANSAVTVLRSPSRVVSVLWSLLSTRKFADGARCGASGSAAVSGFAHSRQNFAAGGFSAPQDAHCRRNTDAHSTQNLARSGFSAPHFEQRISALPLAAPYGPMDARSHSGIKKIHRRSSSKPEETKKEVLPWRGLFRNLNEAGFGVIAGLSVQ